MAKTKIGKQKKLTIYSDFCTPLRLFTLASWVYAIRGKLWSSLWILTAHKNMFIGRLNAKCALQSCFRLKKKPNALYTWYMPAGSELYKTPTVTPPHPFSLGRLLPGCCYVSERTKPKRHIDQQVVGQPPFRYWFRLVAWDIQPYFKKKNIFVVQSTNKKKLPRKLYWCLPNRVLSK